MMNELCIVLAKLPTLCIEMYHCCKNQSDGIVDRVMPVTTQVSSCQKICL
uniref:Uncharacterized protein n=1 Tax=Rhizophora mucronata TaxID=61149 RepID=A0A2P2P9T9_RHIMU